jgi:uncharacterized protein (TIGR03437 family)
MQKLLSTAYKVPALVALLFPYAHAQIRTVVNAASFVENRSLAPGSIVSIFGKNLATATAAADDPQHMPTTLGGVKVDVGGMPCVLFYVSPKQINAEISPNVPLGPAVLTVVAPPGTTTKTLLIEKAAPGVFSTHSSGTRDGAVLNAVTFDRGPFSVTTMGNPTYLALYATGLDLSSAPTVTIGGIDVPVIWSGAAPGFTGLDQINVKLVPELAGAGRVEVAVTAGAKTSNIVEVVILPNMGGGSFPPPGENTSRHRELASLAWVPGGSLALLTDENDDVVRVLDLKQLSVLKTIALPEGAEPVAVAVNATGTLAVVAERDLGRIGILDLAATDTVVSEVSVALGPVSVAIGGDTAVVVSQEQDTVTLINLVTRTVTKTLTVGRGPRYVTLDGNLAYVTNQDDGTVSVIDIAAGAVTSTIDLGSEARPFAIRVLPGLGLAAVTEPSAGKAGKVVFVKLADGSIAATVNVNPEKSGGASDMAVFGSTVYFANQSGGSITAAAVTLDGAAVQVLTSTIRAGLGVRALAIDERDSLLAATNQGSGTVTVYKLPAATLVGRINAVRGENEPENATPDNTDDHDEASNAPSVVSIAPNSGAVGSSFQITIAGEKLTGASKVMFLDPAMMPGHSMGHGNGQGLHGKVDDKITVANVAVSSDGTQLTATVTIAADAAKGERVVRVETPNGDSSFRASAGNTFSVQ